LGVVWARALRTVAIAVKVRIICFNRKSHLEGLYGRRGGIGTRRLVRFFFKVEFLFDPRQPLVERSVEPRELLRQDGQAGDEKSQTRHDGKNEPYNAEEHKSETGSITKELFHNLYYVAKASGAREYQYHSSTLSSFRLYAKCIFLDRNFLS
jgi:hypothetical protein